MRRQHPLPGSANANHYTKGFGENFLLRLKKVKYVSGFQQTTPGKHYYRKGTYWEKLNLPNNTRYLNRQTSVYFKHNLSLSSIREGILLAV